MSEFVQTEQALGRGQSSLELNKVARSRAIVSARLEEPNVVSLDLGEHVLVFVARDDVPPGADGAEPWIEMRVREK